MAVSITFIPAVPIPVPEEAKPDPRYMVKMYFVRDDRPKYWTFHCMSCKSPVVELDGQMAYGVDVVNDTTPRPVSFRWKCQGRYCKFWYIFEALS